MRLEDLTFVECNTKSYPGDDPTTVVNMDEAPCSDPTDDSTCMNPNPDLGSCTEIWDTEGGCSFEWKCQSIENVLHCSRETVCTDQEKYIIEYCRMEPYAESYNRKLVEFASERSLPQTLDTFKHYVIDNLPAEPEVSDDTAKAIIFNIWGGYPRGYTSCGSDPTVEQRVSLFLSSIVDPYLNPLLSDYRLRSQSNAETLHCEEDCATKLSDGFCGAIDFKITSTAFDGDGILQLNNFTLHDNKFTLTGGIPQIELATLNVDVICNPHGLISPNFSVSVSFPLLPSISFTATGTPDRDTVSGNNSDLFCVGPVAEIQDIDIKVPTLSSAVKCKPGDVSPLLLSVKDGFKDHCNGILAKPVLDLVYDEVGRLLKNKLNEKLIPALPGCDTTQVVGPDQLQLSVNWPVPDGQDITAYAGQTYLIEADVEANRNSFASEHIAFLEMYPGQENASLIDAYRVRSRTGVNRYSALWTPDMAGNVSLYFDAMRGKEQVDEVTPVLLNVTVLPAEDGSSSSEEIVPLVDQSAGGDGSGCFIGTLLN